MTPAIEKPDRKKRRKAMRKAFAVHHTKAYRENCVETIAKMRQHNEHAANVSDHYSAADFRASLRTARHHFTAAMKKAARS